MPPYETFEKMSDKLTQAVEETCGFAVEWYMAFFILEEFILKVFILQLFILKVFILQLFIMEMFILDKPGCFNLKV